MDRRPSHMIGSMMTTVIVKMEQMNQVKIICFHLISQQNNLIVFVNVEFEKLALFAI